MFWRVLVRLIVVVVGLGLFLCIVVVSGCCCCFVIWVGVFLISCFVFIWGVGGVVVFVSNIGLISMTGYYPNITEISEKAINLLNK